LSVIISIKGGSSCESRQGETVLDALTRGGIILSAPCGGRGICGNCRIKLLAGTVSLAEKAELQQGLKQEIKSGAFFLACRGTALSDISIELPKEENDAVSGMKSIIQRPNNVRRAGFGLDIGTTTVQAELINLDTGETLDTVSVFNAQRSFGADVMSRINAARNGKTNELHKAINKQIEEIIKYFIGNWELQSIEQCTISGNTTMLHLFSGVDPSGMGEVPFTPVFLEERFFSGKELSLPVEQITLLPGISAFVGADIVSGLAFLDMLNQNDNTLFIDIGTNGEMALWKKSEQRLFCCSTAAGPCFEGAEISCGMGAVPGAINRISLEEKPAGADKVFNYGPLVYTTLGNIPPRGICGSALIDLMAAMKSLAVIDETGSLTKEYAQAGFSLAEGLAISQKDIRQFQLAKSAILSGITILAKKAGLENPGQLNTVYIAGGLGFFIDIKNAVTAGLLPSEFSSSSRSKSDIAVCGNTSLKGAVKSLVDKTFLSRCREIIAKKEMVELGADGDFAEAFAENMYF